MFEENAMLFDWNNLQKLIFAKKKLLGLAKLYVQSEKGLTTWEKLREALLKEFSKRLNSAELHRMLAERRKHKQESCEEYYLIMREMASRGNIEAEAVIHYIIDGIMDSMPNKAVLYGANNYQDFKEKLKIYSLIKTKSNINFHVLDKNKILTRSSHVQNYPNKKTDPQPRCYSCGELGHVATRCPDKDKGVKCYRCNNFGHLSNACTVVAAGKRQDTSNYDTKAEKVSYSNTVAPDKVMVISNTDMMKRLCVGGTELDCLIDTGFDVNLINSSTYFRVAENCTFMNAQIDLRGLGGNTVTCLGKIDTNIIIDDIKYKTRFYIVADDSMKSNVIIGKELLSQIDIVVNKGIVSLNKMKQQNAVIEESRCKDKMIFDKEEKINNLEKKYEKSRHDQADLRKKLCEIKQNLNVSIKNEQNLQNKIQSYKHQLETIQADLKKAQKLNEELMEKKLAIVKVIEEQCVNQEELKNQKEVLSENVSSKKCIKKVQEENKRIVQINCLRKMSAGNEEWFKHVPRLQKALNSTYQRSIATEPFNLLFGVKMRRTEDLELLQIIDEESRKVFCEERGQLRDEAKKAIERVQDENRRTYNARRKRSRGYTVGDFVVIKKTQFGQNNKLHGLFMGPYEVTKVHDNDRYEVRRIGEGSGPKLTTSAADNMKPYQFGSFGTNDLQDGRSVGDLGDLSRSHGE